MFRLLRRILSAFGLLMLCLSITLPTPASASGQARWKALFIVDVSQNIGYLTRTDGTYTVFPVATGQRATVHYIGRTYRAATPIRTWIAQKKMIKGDRRTFGMRGLFIRLQYEDEDTAYGIHSYFKVNEWMQEEYRYRSMGCIVVTEEMLAVIEGILDEYGAITVITTNDGPGTLVAVAGIASTN